MPALLSKPVESAVLPCIGFSAVKPLGFCSEDGELFEEFVGFVPGGLSSGETVLKIHEILPSGFTVATTWGTTEEEFQAMSICVRCGHEYVTQGYCDRCFTVEPDLMVDMLYPWTLRWWQSLDNPDYDWLCLGHVEADRQVLVLGEYAEDELLDAWYAAAMPLYGLKRQGRLDFWVLFNKGKMRNDLIAICALEH
jgi:hypothetical protein